MKLFSFLNLPSKDKPAQMKFMIGLGLTIMSFLGVCVIIYAMHQTTLAQEGKINELDEEVAAIKSEKNVVEIELEQFKAEADSIKLSKIVEVANTVYDEKERSRRVGVLWVDRKNKTYVVTLGAIHGLTVGSALSVYEGDKKIGMVSVDILYDVISFTIPVKPWDDLSSKSYFRAVIE